MYGQELLMHGGSCEPTILLLKVNYYLNWEYAGGGGVPSPPRYCRYLDGMHYHNCLACLSKDKFCY